MLNKTYSILLNKHHRCFWNRNIKFATFYCYFALFSLETSDFSFNSVELAIIKRRGGKALIRWSALIRQNTVLAIEKQNPSKGTDDHPLPLGISLFTRLFSLVLFFSQLPLSGRGRGRWKNKGQPVPIASLPGHTQPKTYFLPHHLPAFMTLYPFSLLALLYCI